MGLQFSAKYTLVYQLNILLLSLMYENKDLFLNTSVLQLFITYYNQCPS